jgi:hypothetical protein
MIELQGKGLIIINNTVRYVTIWYGTVRSPPIQVPVYATVRYDTVRYRCRFDAGKRINKILIIFEY